MMDRTDPPGGEPAQDPVAELREIPSRYREVLAGERGEEPASPPTGGLPPEAVEEAAHTRDLLDAAARQVERLVEDSKPLADPIGNPPPKRGHYNLDPEVVLEVLETNAERLAQLVETVPDEAAARDPAVREGLQAISGELVSEAVTESERRLRDAQRAVEGE